MMTSVAVNPAFALGTSFAALAAAPEAGRRGACGGLRSRGTCLNAIALGGTHSEVWRAGPPVDLFRGCRTEDIAYTFRVELDAQGAPASIGRATRPPKASLEIVHR